jgi:hypothetical protein
MTIPTMSDQQLLDYSGEHLLHELSMLWELAECLPQKKANTETSALVESYGIHLRNLIDFFYRKGKRDDVTARDFLDPTITWAPKEPISLTKAHQRANKELSHLTQARKSGSLPEKAWDTRGLLKEIAAVAKDFADKASQKKLHPKVREFLQLQPEQKLLWIADNVSHMNVAVSLPIGVGVVSPYISVSTQTQLIHKIDLTEPGLSQEAPSSNTSTAHADPAPTRRSD